MYWQFCPENNLIIPFSDITLFHPHWDSQRAHTLSRTAISVSLRRTTTAILYPGTDLDLFHSLSFFFELVLLFHFCNSIQCLLLHNHIRSLLLVSWIFAIQCQLCFRNEWVISMKNFSISIQIKFILFFTTLWIIKVKTPKLKLYDMIYLQSVLILEWLALRYFEFLELIFRNALVWMNWVFFFFYRMLC